MKTKIVISSLILALGLSTMAQAQTILLATRDNSGSQVQEYKTLIQGVYPDATILIGGFSNGGSELTDLSVINDADLLIIARRHSSGQWDDGAEQILINSTTTPIFCNNTFVSRDGSDELSWHQGGSGTNTTQTGMTVVDASDPIFTGPFPVTLTAGDTKVNVWSTATTTRRINAGANASTLGTVVATANEVPDTHE